MGMYTKFNVILPIKNDTPKNIKEILIDIVDNGGNKIEKIIEDGILTNDFELPKHDLFKNSNRLFCAKCSSYYFTGTSNSAIKYNDLIGDSIHNRMVLHIDCDFKNYENEIDLFLDFVAPYIDEKYRILLGYSICEDTDEPTLYFINNGKIEIQEIN